MDSSLFLEGVVVFILEQGLGKARRNILTKQVVSRGGGVASTVSQGDLTHVIVGDKVKSPRLPQLLKVDAVPDNITVVRADWLSSCFVAGQQLETTPYQLIDQPIRSTSHEKGKPVKRAQQDSEDETPHPKVSKTTPTKCSVIWAAAEPDSDSDYIESDGEGAGPVELPKREELEEEGLIRSLPKKGKWLCQVPSTQLKGQDNCNKPLTDKLEELLVTYKSSSLPKDKWRAMSLSKALSAIKKHNTQITSYEEARGIPFVGDRLAEKIQEIVTSGHLRRLDMVDREKERAIECFMGIHGVGKATAEEFYAKGYRTLDDVKGSGELNRIQQIGMKYYTEFRERMSRVEVEEIERRVRRACHGINEGLEVVTCGSYRRGRATCGDVDIMVTHPDGRAHKNVFQPLLHTLREEGFLTDDLTVHDDKGEGSGCKYLGVCKLEGAERKHRRIDIYTCPYSEYPLMLLHFTGSGHFNRSMRHKADKMGMSLSEHSLNVGVIRKSGVKVFEGTPLPVFSERDVFKYLDIPYLEPHDRDLA